MKTQQSLRNPSAGVSFVFFWLVALSGWFVVPAPAQPAGEEAKLLDIERKVAHGYATNDGVRIHYEIYGEGERTMLFVPAWSIVHSRAYNAQIPYFSDRFRVVSYDPRGTGKSERPSDTDRYTLDEYVGDALAVMDAAGAERAILFGYSFGGLVSSVIAGHPPERVEAMIA